MGERWPLTGRSPTEERAAHPRFRQRSRAAVDVPIPGACALPDGCGLVPARGTASASPLGTPAWRHCGVMAPLDAREAAPRRCWQRCRSQGGPQGPDPTAGAAARRAEVWLSSRTSRAGPAMVRRRRRGRGARPKARGRGPHDRARAPDPAVLGLPATTRDPTHPSPEKLHGSVRIGRAFGGECPALGREGVHRRASGRCAWGVRSRHNPPCVTPDSPADRAAMRWPRAAGAHGACGRPRLPVRTAVLARPSTTGCRVRMGRALRPNCRYTATDSRIDRSRMRWVEHGRVRMGAFARRRPPVV